MELKDILKTVDHTLLTQTASWDDMKILLDDAVTFQTASVCIPPCYVKKAADYLNGRIPVCTVIGFPNGYQTTEVKCFEAKQAVSEGAAEIDMVINIGLLKSGAFAEIAAEIAAIKEVCGHHILKVIIETCLLTQEEKIKMCEIISNSGADFIKTSTGFSEKGATFEDVALMKEHVVPGLKIKAAGGIATLEDAKKFLSLGAERLGTSRIVKLAKNERSNGY